jgi:hypothetical protein
VLWSYGEDFHLGVLPDAYSLHRDGLPYSERTFDAALVFLGLSLGAAGTDRDTTDEIVASINNEVRRVCIWDNGWHAGHWCVGEKRSKQLLLRL